MLDGSAEFQLDACLSDLRAVVARVFEAQVPEISVDWEMSDRAISEIGGRILEDFVLRHVAEVAAELPRKHSRSLTVNIPASGRTVEDFRLLCKIGDSTSELLVDIKGHNQFRKGSRPNLASLRKCRALYSNPSLVHQELVIFLCRYEPLVRRSRRRTQVRYQVSVQSFDDRHVIPIRWLGRRNLDPANIGSGGQLLLAREESIIVERRSRADFVRLLEELGGRLVSRAVTP